MAQPIRKKIQEQHSGIIKEAPFYTLLIDGNSLLFNCMADDKVNSDGVHYGGVFQFLLQMKIIMSKRAFDYVYVFFDNEYSGYLRYLAYKPYKANRDKKYSDYGLSDYMKACNARIASMTKYFKEKNGDKTKHNNKKTSTWEDFVDANFDRERDIICACLNELFVRWYIDDVVEGDDLISYYCKHKKDNEKIYIISSDMDLSQLLADDIAIYNQKIKKFITKDNFKETFGYYYENILVKKVFCGDVSDNIGNIKGLSETGFFNLMPEAYTKKITIDEVKERAQSLINERKKEKKKPLQVHENIIKGVSNKQYDGDFFEINTKIIDLKNPLLTNEAQDEMDSMRYAPQSIEDRSFSNLYNIIVKEKIEELIGDTRFSSFFSTFNQLIEKEKKRYDDYVASEK